MARSPAKKPRSPGRPAAAGNTDLREHVLDRAVDLFAGQGIEATPLRTIAKSAGVTPALLHYYFGSKPQLVGALIAERLMPIVGQMREAIAGSDGNNAALVATFVNTAFGMIERHPWFPPLWVREVLSEGGALRELIVTRIAPQAATLLEKRFQTAKKKGEIHPDLDPRLLVVSLIGLTLFLAASTPIWRRVFRADDIGIDTLRKHTLALLSHGIGKKAAR